MLHSQQTQSESRWGLGYSTTPYWGGPVETANANLEFPRPHRNLGISRPGGGAKTPRAAETMNSHLDCSENFAAAPVKAVHCYSRQQTRVDLAHGCLRQWWTHACARCVSAHPSLRQHRCHRYYFLHHCLPPHLHVWNECIVSYAYTKTTQNYFVSLVQWDVVQTFFKSNRTVLYVWNSTTYLHGLHHWLCWSSPKYALHFFALGLSLSDAFCWQVISRFFFRFECSP